MTTTAKATLYLIVDRNGEWSGAGMSTKEPQTDLEAINLISEWGLCDDLGACKAYKVVVDVPIPTDADIEEISAKLEPLGLVL